MTKSMTIGVQILYLASRIYSLHSVCMHVSPMFPSFALQETKGKIKIHFVSFTDDDECRMIIFKEPLSDKAVTGHLIRKEEVSTDGSCRVLCYIEPDCVSINIAPGKDGNYQCELNDATEENIALVNKKNYIYLSIEVRPEFLQSSRGCSTL